MVRVPGRLRGDTGARYSRYLMQRQDTADLALPYRLLHGARWELFVKGPEPTLNSSLLLPGRYLEVDRGDYAAPSGAILNARAPLW